MPANVYRAKNFLLDTDYPLDMVVYLITGSISMTGSSAGTAVIHHELDFTPLCSGSWALTPDFSVQYEYDSGTFPSNNIGVSLFDQTLSLSTTLFGNSGGADSTNVNILWINNNSSPMTAYYRVYALGPPDVPVMAPYTASSGDKFILNTDYNYTKLYINSSQDLSPGNTYTTNHNLTYVPQLGLWTRRTSNGLVSPYDTQNVQSSFFDFTVSVNGSSLVLQTDSPTTINKEYVRLYLDDN